MQGCEHMLCPGAAWKALMTNDGPCQGGILKLLSVKAAMDSHVRICPACAHSY